MKFIVAHADTLQTLGIYEAPAINYQAIESEFPVIHAELTSTANPADPYFVARDGKWYCVSRLEQVVADAKRFGLGIIDRFAAENIALGITQAGKTGDVRRAMINVVSALYTGSLYDAMAEARSIPTESKDATFITDARLLLFINTIEDYLRIPRSTSL
jgi:hypothetical protein